METFILAYLTENELLWNVCGIAVCSSALQTSFHIYDTPIKFNLFCKIYNCIVELYLF